MAVITNPQVNIDVIFDNDTALGGGGVITSDFISANIYPNPGLLFDQIQFLCRHSSVSYAYYEIIWDIDQAGYVNSNILRAGAPVVLPVLIR